MDNPNKPLKVYLVAIITEDVELIVNSYVTYGSKRWWLTWLAHGSEQPYCTCNLLSSGLRMVGRF